MTTASAGDAEARAGTVASWMVTTTLLAALDETASGGAVLVEVRVATDLRPVLARTGRDAEGNRLVTEALART